MQKIVILPPLLLVLFSSAQSTQIKRYLEQIAANKVYVEYLNKAISVARYGLTTIGNIRNGELSLHQLFFKELNEVNPKIKNWTKVAQIIDYQVNILKSYKKSYKQIQASGQFTNAELKYIVSVFSKLINDCSKALDMLYDVLNGATYKMSDDERIKRIETLFANMQSNYKFCQEFANNNTALAIQRLQDQKETDLSRKLFNAH